jgi:hypothetical protein
MGFSIFAMLLALALPPPAVSAPSASPSPAPTPLKTIATVKSNSPYCSSLLEHFNGAIAPMIASDRTLDQVNDQLIDLKSVFDGPNYAQKFTIMRPKLVKYVGELQKNLTVMQNEVNKLRAGEKLTTDPQEAAKMHQLGEKMQLAYNKQMQLASDLLGVVQGMMQYNVFEGDHPIGGHDAADLSMPADMKDIKSYLKFDGQRDVIADAESKAGDLAYDIAEKSCK